MQTQLQFRTVRCFALLSEGFVWTVGSPVPEHICILASLPGCAADTGCGLGNAMMALVSALSLCKFTVCKMGIFHEIAIGRYGV